MYVLTGHWEKHPEVSEMSLLQDKGMEPHLQDNEHIPEHSSSCEETVALGPSTNRFNALLTLSNDEDL